jgi:hypothetical protein
VKSGRGKYTREEETVSVTISDNIKEVAKLRAQCSNTQFLTSVERMKDGTNNGGASVM